MNNSEFKELDGKRYLRIESLESAGIKKCTVYTCLKRKAKGWFSIEDPDNKNFKLVEFDPLPDQYKDKIIAKLGDPNAKNSSLPDVIETPINRLTQKDQETMWARWNVTLEFDKVREHAKVEKRNVEDALDAFYFIFCHDERWIECRKTLANSKGELPAIKTIYTWSRDLKKDRQPLTLAPEKREKREDQTFTEEQSVILLRYYANQHEPSYSTGYKFYCEMCSMRGWAKPSYNKFRNYIKQLYLKKGVAIDAARHGEKYAKDKHGAYIERLNDIRFMDVIVADGHLMNFPIKDDDNRKFRPMFIGYMDMATSKIMGFELMRSESTIGVASAFRSTMLIAGEMMGLKGMGIVPREVYTDNGKAFKNQFFDGLADFGNYQEGVYARFKQFGLQYVTHSIAYNARAKTIERKFRDFDPYEKRESNYSGSSIDKRPAKYRRNELIAKEQYTQMLEENGWLDLHSAYAMISNWVEEWNNQPCNGKYLQGYSPNELAAKHIIEIKDWGTRCLPYRELNNLMMHRKTVRLEANGVRINSIPYINPLEMALVPKDAGIYVQVAFSPLEPDKVQVYNEDGTYWCEAEKWIGYNVSASYKQRGSEAQEHHKKAMEAQGTMRKMVEDATREIIGLPPKATRKKQLALAEAKQRELPENTEGSTKFWVTKFAGTDKEERVLVDLSPSAICNQ